MTSRNKCWTTRVPRPYLPGLMLTFAGSFLFANLVTLTLRGLKAEHLRLHGGPAHAKVLLTDEWVAQIACLADSKDLLHVQAASLLSSIFLMRVQSGTLK